MAIRGIRLTPAQRRNAAVISGAIALIAAGLGNISPGSLWPLVITLAAIAVMVGAVLAPVANEG